MAADRANGLFDLNGLGGDDTKIEVGQLGRVGSSFQLDCEFVTSRDVQAFAVEGFGMVFATHEGPDFGDARQVRRVQRTDGATADDADFLHLSCYLFSTFTSFARSPPSCCLRARKMLSALLNESSIKIPCANNASCKADDIVWIGAAPPSPMPFAPL